MRLVVPAVVLFVALLGCGADPLPPTDDGGSGGAGGGASGGAGGEPGGSGGGGGVPAGGSGGGGVDPLAACTAAGSECNAGVCSFASIDCGAAADGLLAQCATGLCGMMDRDGNCPAREATVAQCERERAQDAYANTFWHCMVGSTACGDTFDGCVRVACNPND